MSSTRDTDSELPHDRNSAAIQALSPDDDNITTIMAGGASTSAEVAGRVAGRSVLVEIAASTDVHIAFGASGITATTSSRFFPKGAAVYKLLPGQSHVAVLEAASSGGSGPVTITPLR